MPPRIASLVCKMPPNVALDLAPFGRCALRQEAAQRRLASGWPPQENLMRIRLKLFAALLALSLSVTSCFAATPAPYEVSVTLSHAGKSFASPSAVVQAGKPASIEVTGTDGYKLTFTVSDLTPDTIKVVASLASSYGSMAPTVVVRPDQPARVAVGDLGLEITVRRGGG